MGSSGARSGVNLRAPRFSGQALLGPLFPVLQECLWRIPGVVSTFRARGNQVGA
ncbi:hypothetical protein LINPERHAP1_LOCUS31690 [Linum perenne]